MQISAHSSGSSWSLKATPGSLDASPPMPTFIAERAPRKIGADRLAVASALLFGRNCSESLAFEAALSTYTAEAIRSFLDGRVQALPIDPEPKALPVGQTVLCLADERSAAQVSEPSIFGKREIAFFASRLDRSSGVSNGLHSFAISSNVWLFSRLDLSLSVCEALTGLAVLFSEDLEADEIRVPEGMFPGIVEAGSIATLLESVRLGIGFEGRTGLFSDQL